MQWAQFTLDLLNDLIEGILLEMSFEDNCFDDNNLPYHDIIGNWKGRDRTTPSLENLFTYFLFK